jgi:hypothetical protein
MTTNSNPLRQFFRQPAIYLTLPSGGAHWPAGSLDLPHNGELAVLPMTAIDEITYRTPDALFNGQAVINVVQSCIPGIKNAWHMPAQDFNAVMAAIRIASYGHAMDMDITCPECANIDTFSLDLRTVLDQLRSPDYESALEVNGLDITFQPMTFEQQNKISTDQFEYQRLIQAIPASDLTDEAKMAEMAAVMTKIQALTMRVLTTSIATIRTPQALVTEAAFITEFLQNCDRQAFAAIREHVIRLRESVDLKPMTVTCTACKHEHAQQLNLDQSSFFAGAS